MGPSPLSPLHAFIFIIFIARRIQHFIASSTRADLCVDDTFYINGLWDAYDLYIFRSMYNNKL